MNDSVTDVQFDAPIFSKTFKYNLVQGGSLNDSQIDQNFGVDPLTITEASYNSGTSLNSLSQTYEECPTNSESADGSNRSILSLWYFQNIGVIDQCLISFKCT